MVLMTIIMCKLIDTNADINANAQFRPTAQLYTRQTVHCAREPETTRQGVTCAERCSTGTKRKNHGRWIKALQGRDRISSFVA
ncbi:hypothetical protein PMAC_002887 [Pneumocystis sp. 'macacae']|nr:hypothetical protein PMAC_002887 [Pneumocystis sp. 'macacae']